VRIALPVFALLICGGCSLPQDTPTGQQVAQVSKVEPYQRFVPIAQNAAGTPSLDYALDTKTGQICKTWDWQITPAPPGSRSEGINEIPECLALYQQDPDKAADGTGNAGKIPNELEH
jgi:hypothetical protein